MDYLDGYGDDGDSYARSAGMAAPDGTSFPTSPQQQPSFWQNLAGAFGRSNQAGGGLTGLGAALNPQWSQNAPTQTQGAAPLNWGNNGQSGSGLNGFAQNVGKAGGIASMIGGL